MAMATKDADNTATAVEGTKIRWDDSNMKSAYANVCNVSSGQKEVTVQLTDRIIVSPFAAKRLSVLLGAVVKEYENRFGALNIDLAGTPGAVSAAPPKK